MRPQQLALPSRPTLLHHTSRRTTLQSNPRLSLIYNCSTKEKCGIIATHWEMPGHGRGGVRSGPPRVHTPTGPGTHVHTPTGPGTQPPAGPGTQPPAGPGTQPPAGPGTQPPAGPAGSTPFKVDVPVGHALDLDFDIAVKHRKVWATKSERRRSTWSIPIRRLKQFQ